jgi:hypothetical protein
MSFVVVLNIDLVAADILIGVPFSCLLSSICGQRASRRRGPDGKVRAEAAHDRVLDLERTSPAAMALLCFHFERPADRHFPPLPLPSEDARLP